MHIAIRADASTTIGSGHIMRCLTLATEMRRRGHTVFFISRVDVGCGQELITGNGFEHLTLPSASPFDPMHDAAFTENVLAKKCGAADLLIIDHYGIDATWESRLANSAHKILVIDDQANRPHHANFLLDQNYAREAQSRYQGKINPSCQLLLGPEYALIREEFLPYINNNARQTSKVNRILISYGGPDITGETLKALLALEQCGYAGSIDCVVGKANPQLDVIIKKCALMANTTLHVQTSEMARLMAEADLALGAGGTTTWERCALGLPALVTVVADNQVHAVHELHTYGAIEYAGKSENTDIPGLAIKINDLINTPKKLNEMRRLAITLVDGNGCAKICNVLEKK